MGSERCASLHSLSQRWTAAAAAAADRQRSRIEAAILTAAGRQQDGAVPAAQLRAHLRECSMVALTGSPDRCCCLPLSVAAIATRIDPHCSAHPFQLHFTLFLSPSCLRWSRKRRSSCWLRRRLSLLLRAVTTDVFESPTLRTAADQAAMVHGVIAAAAWEEFRRFLQLQGEAGQRGDSADADVDDGLHVARLCARHESLRQAAGVDRHEAAL